jgi:hypothetical protein
MRNGGAYSGLGEPIAHADDHGEDMVYLRMIVNRRKVLALHWRFAPLPEAGMAPGTASVPGNLVALVGLATERRKIRQAETQQTAGHLPCDTTA